MQRAMDKSRSFLATAFSRARDLEGQRMAFVSQVIVFSAARDSKRHIMCIALGHDTDSRTLKYGQSMFFL